MNNQKFLICQKCKNLVGILEDSGVPIYCCGNEMTVLEANSSNASGEKHLPIVNIEGDKVYVTVGANTHPMTEEHSIDWVYLQLKHGGQRKSFKKGQEPTAVFTVDNDKPIAVFAYCNQHGLWRTDIE